MSRFHTQHVRRHPETPGHSAGAGQRPRTPRRQHLRTPRDTDRPSHRHFRRQDHVRETEPTNRPGLHPQIHSQNELSTLVKLLQRCLRSSVSFQADGFRFQPARPLRVDEVNGRLINGITSTTVGRQLQESAAPDGVTQPLTDGKQSPTTTQRAQLRL